MGVSNFFKGTCSTPPLKYQFKWYTSTFEFNNIGTEQGFLIETNSFNINAIPGDKIVLTVNKGAMLRDIREKSRNKVTKSGKKGENSVNMLTKLHNNEVKMTEKRVKITEIGTISVISVQNSSDFEVFGKIEVF